jgi:hypothetical protein
MSRSPLAYPLTRGADPDVGGAADLQTDVMRFMAILALCLVAIFALVQSIPLAPAPEKDLQVREITTESVTSEELPDVTPLAPPEPAAQASADTAVILTRPKRTPGVTPQEPVEATEATPAETIPAPKAVPAEPEQDGFTLRFASDGALMRAVAAHRVGVYAIEPARARRMTVSESRISFWDASMPNSFHEMETSTVPVAVVAALSRAVSDTESVKWGVTLPGRMKAQLDALMEEHSGGALVIGADGDIHREVQ